MFEYDQGYEIDGSDSSYTILTPEKRKCLEILKYFFSLKIIHRGRVFRIENIRGHRKQVFQDKEFIYEEIDTVLEDMVQSEVRMFDIVFPYVETDALFPEVKQDIVDTLFEIEGEKTPSLQNGTFYDLYHSTEIVTVFLDPVTARKTQDYSISLSTEDYVKHISQGDFFLLELNCRLGGAFQYAVYAMSKLSKRFPELDIEVKESADYIDTYGKEAIYHGVCECIETEVYDLAEAIERIMTNPSVQKGDTYRTPEPEKIRLAHVPLTLEGYGKKEQGFDFSETHDGTFKIKSDTPHYDILQGIYQKNNISVADYVQGVKKLSQVSYFSDIDFGLYTAFYIYVDCGKAGRYLCEVKLKRQKDHLILCVVVPFRRYKEVKKLLNL